MEKNDAIKEFSQKFIVDEKLVKSYLSSLEAVKNIRQKEQVVVHQQQQTRDVSDYKWQELVENCITNRCKVKSACEPSGPSGRSLSRFL